MSELPLPLPFLFKTGKDRVDLQDGEVDDACFYHPTFVHIERMGKKKYWIGVADSEGKVIHFDLYSKKKKIHVFKRED